MEIKIRKAHADDIPHVMALQANSLRVLSVGIYSPAQIETLVRTQSEARVRSFNSGDEVLFVAYTKADETRAPGSLSGYLSVDSVDSSVRLVAIAAFISSRAQVGGLYVHPAFTRRGIASQLLQVIEAEAASQGHRMIKSMSSLVAVPFYEARGFRRLFSRTVFFEGEAVSCVEMAKSLGSGNLLLEMARKMVLTIGPLMTVVAVVWCVVLWM